MQSCKKWKKDGLHDSCSSQEKVLQLNVFMLLPSESQMYVALMKVVKILKRTFIIPPHAPVKSEGQRSLVIRPA